MQEITPSLALLFPNLPHNIDVMRQIIFAISFDHLHPLIKFRTLIELNCNVDTSTKVIHLRRNQRKDCREKVIQERENQTMMKHFLAELLIAALIPEIPCSLYASASRKYISAREKGTPEYPDEKDPMCLQCVFRSVRLIGRRSSRLQLPVAVADCKKENLIPHAPFISSIDAAIVYWSLLAPVAARNLRVVICSIARSLSGPAVFPCQSAGSRYRMGG